MAGLTPGSVLRNPFREVEPGWPPCIVSGVAPFFPIEAAYYFTSIGDKTGFPMIGYDDITQMTDNYTTIQLDYRPIELESVKTGYPIGLKVRCINDIHGAFWVKMHVAGGVHHIGPILDPPVVTIEGWSGITWTIEDLEPGSDPNRLPTGSVTIPGTGTASTFNPADGAYSNVGLSGGTVSFSPTGGSLSGFTANYSSYGGPFFGGAISGSADVSGSGGIVDGIRVPFVAGGNANNPFASLEWSTTYDSGGPGTDDNINSLTDLGKI